MNYINKAEIKDLPLDILLDQVWPESFSLIKDSGSWKVYNDDMETCFSYQLTTETLESFIRRVLLKMLNHEPPFDHIQLAGIRSDLACAQITNHMKKDTGGYSETEINCTGCYGPCGRCEEVNQQQ